MLNHMGAAYNAAAASSPLEGAGPQSSRRHCLIVLVFALAALALSACGGSGSTNPPASRPSTTTGSPSTPTSKPSVALPSTTTRPTEAPTTTVPPTSTPTTEAPTTTVPPTTTPPRRRDDDDGPAHDDSQDGGADDEVPDDSDRGNLHVIDTLGLDRRWTPPRSRPRRCPRTLAPFTIPASSSHGMEAQRRAGVAAGGSRPRSPLRGSDKR